MATNNGTSGSKTSADLLIKLDQLIEENQQLEKQNRKLMDAIDSLRKLLAQQTAESPTRSEAEPAASFNSTVAQKETSNQQPAKQGGQVAAPAQGNKDDQTLLSEGSSGNPAMFGEFNPGHGYTVGRSELGELNLSGYMAARFLDQLPNTPIGVDHLGRSFFVNPRRDFQFHRVMLFSQGWLFSPKFQYTTFLWTVQDTNQVAVGGALLYNFGQHMTLGMGWNAYPGTMSLQGSHPYWLSYDRVMADEFFRPYFSQGVFAQGNILPRLEYRWMVGNNNSNLDVPAVKLDRDLSHGFAITWLPTTGEFGPRGAFGDFEDHQSLATRFNFAYTNSLEDRQAPLGSPPGNTTLRLSDSLNVFDTGTFTQGVTVGRAHYQLFSAAAGMKYRGLFLQGEGYARKLNDFVADGPLPVGVVRDSGFYVQLGYMAIPQKAELYGSTSYVFGQYGDAKEFIVGGNYYPWKSRNARLNIQLINVDKSPVSSTFGFYLGQLKGPIFTIGMTAFY